MAITDLLRVYFKFEEASGTRTDEITGLTLTDNNTCPQVAGKNGNAVGFTAASSEYLSAAHNENFSIDTAEDGFSVCFWAYPTAANTPASMVSKGLITGGGNNFEWSIEQDDGTNDALFFISPDGATIAVVDSGDEMTINDWNFVACRYRSSDGHFTCRVNCGADGTGTSADPYNGSEEFRIARYSNNVGPYWSGRIDELGIWDRYLSDAELDTLCLGTSFFPYAPTNTKVWSWVG